MATPASWQSERRRCGDCGFDPHDVRDHELAMAMRALGDRWVAFVDAISRRDDGDAVLHARPREDGRSALEYEQHLLERLQAFAEAMERALGTSSAESEPIDLTDEQDPDVLLGRIAVYTDEMAMLLRGFSWPHRASTQPSRQAKIADAARTALHEGYHHLAEAERAVQAVLHL